ncbi:MAG TPA: hypothetical protein DCK95_03795 [Anaerolineaceae bacterium]|nr:hypothetical protein [Anaerolineaceae bacterium]
MPLNRLKYTEKIHVKTKETTTSPKWSPATKIIIVVILLVIAVAILIRFSDLIPVVGGAFVISTILKPAARFLHEKLKFSWGLASGLLVILLVLVIVGALVWGGVSIVEEIQGLIEFLSTITTDVSTTIQNLSEIKFDIGPIHIDLSYIDWNVVGDRVLEYAQPIISGLGNSIGGLASGAAGAIGNFFLTTIIAYLILNESQKQNRDSISSMIPGYEEDIRHLREEMNTIWNAFFRGQAKVFVVRVCIYLVLLGVLQVRYFVLLAFLAGFANFVPYIGVAVAWTVYFLVALFQGSTAFGLQPLPYAAIVSLSGWLIDNIYDNVYTPRVMAGSLKLHPAWITIGALIGLELFGILGMVFAAPILATTKLIFHYVLRKILDLDPWEDIEKQHYSGDVSGFFGKAYQKAQNGVKQAGEKVGEKIKEVVRRK